MAGMMGLNQTDKAQSGDDLTAEPGNDLNATEQQLAKEFKFPGTLKIEAENIKIQFLTNDGKIHDVSSGQKVGGNGTPEVAGFIVPAGKTIYYRDPETGKHGSMVGNGLKGFLLDGDAKITRDYEGNLVVVGGTKPVHNVEQSVKIANLPPPTHM